MIEVKKNGERIKISFPYDPDNIIKIKKIEGYRRHPEGKYWNIHTQNQKDSSLFDKEDIIIDLPVWLL